MASTTNTDLLRITFLHPRSGDTFDAEIGIATTGQQALDELRRASWLPDPGRGAFALAIKDVTLDLSRSLAEQGATTGASIQVVLTGVGAAMLSPSQRRSRLALDGRMLLAMRDHQLAIVGASTPGAATQGQRLADPAIAAGDAQCYIVTLRFPMLAPDRSPLHEASIRFDLTSPNYPFAAPGVQVVSCPRPWSPHVHPVGTVCIGETWAEARGEMLLGQLVVHVMHLLNLDEPDRPSIDAYDVDALLYWRSRGSRPINPGLRYPALPEECELDLSAERGVFGGTARSQHAADVQFRQVVR